MLGIDLILKESLGQTLNEVAGIANEYEAKLREIKLTITRIEDSANSALETLTELNTILKGIKHDGKGGES